MVGRAFSRKKTSYKPKYSYKFIEGDSVVYCELEGYLTEEFLKKLIEEHTKHLDILRANKKPALLLTDITKVIGVRSGARRSVDTYRNFKVDRSAIIGANPFLTLITQYVLRLTGIHKQHHIFRSKFMALRWLKGKGTPPRLTLARAFAGAVAVVGSLALVGGMTGITMLQSIMYLSQPLDPLAAAYIVLAGIILLLLATVGLSLVRRVVVRVLALWLILFSFNGLAVAWLGVGIVHPALSDLTFSSDPRFLSLLLLVGGLIWMATYPLIRKLSSNIFRFTMIPTIVSTLVWVVANALGIAPVYSLGVALLFFAIEVSLLQITYRPPGRFPVARFIVFRYWQSIVVFVAIFSVAIIAWHIVRVAQENDSLVRVSDQIQVQSEADGTLLSEFRAFYNASEFVTAEEFDYYFSEYNIRRHSEGIVSLIYSEKTADRQPLTYVFPSDAPTPKDIDFTEYAGSRILLDAARVSGEVQAGRVEGLPLNGQPADISLMVLALYTSRGPLPATEQADKLKGFIIADFDARVFLENFFAEHMDDNAMFVVTDQDTGEVYYRSPGAESATTDDVLNARTLSVAGMTWDVQIIRNNFGDGNLLSGPNVLLLMGAIIGLIFGIVTALLIRSRYRIQKLANEIELDMHRESRRATALAQKDEAIIESIGEGLVVTDQEGKVTRVNKRFTELTGWSSEEVVGREFVDVIPMLNAEGKKVPPSQRFVQQVLDSKGGMKKVASLNDKLRYVRKDGTDFPAAITVAPVVIGREVSGVIEVMRDITSEAEIDRVKTEFVSLASHQLRSPLTATKWYSELLLSDETNPLSEIQRKYVEGVHTGVVRTIRLVNSLLNISRFEVGSIAVAPEPTDLKAFIHDLLQEYQQQMTNKHLQLSEKLQSGIQKIDVDPKLLEIILDNLLTNAIKYTPEGGSVTVTLRQQDHHVDIAVSDTGYGIPQRQQDMLFTKLFRADNIKTKNTDGTGLGLYLVKSIIDYTKCKIRFESTENVGSTFYVSIPASGMENRSGTTRVADVKE